MGEGLHTAGVWRLYPPLPPPPSPKGRGDFNALPDHCFMSTVVCSICCAVVTIFAFAL